MDRTTSSKPTLGIFSINSCGGCVEQLLNADTLLVDLADQVDIVYWQRLMDSQCPEHVDIAVVEGLEGFNNTERIEGFVDQIEKQHPDIKIVASQAADWEREKGYSVAQNIMQANPDVKAFFAASDEMAIGAAQAMKDDGVDGIVTIGIDGNSATMDSIDEGVTTASLDTDPYNIGVTAVEKAIDAIDGKEIDDNKVIVPCFIVDKDNVADYLK